MDSNKKYWKGLEELNKTPEFVEKNKHEFAEPIPIEEVLSGGGLVGKNPSPRLFKGAWLWCGCGYFSSLPKSTGT
jgi:MoCo/4Fe-4S cofactor protein with predicted Tat translocation signal